MSQLLQKNNVLFALLVSENMQRMLNEAFNEIGTINKAIKIRRLAIKDAWEFDESFFFDENLFKEVWLLNLMSDSNSLLYISSMKN